MVEKSSVGRGDGSRLEPKRVPVGPETAYDGEQRVLLTVTARMKLSTVVNGQTVWKEVSIGVGRDAETGEVIFYPGGQGQKVRWQDLRWVLPEEEVEQIRAELRKIADRRRGGYKP